MSQITYSSIKKIISAGVEWGLDSVDKSKTFSQILVFGKVEKKSLVKHLKPNIYIWQWQELERKKFSSRAIYHTEKGPVSYLPLCEGAIKKYTPAQLQKSMWGIARDAMGIHAAHFSHQRAIEIVFIHCTKEQIKGAILGLGISQYSFKSSQEKKCKVHFKFIGNKIDKKDLEFIQAQYEAVNLSRHLVNLPSGSLDPKSYVTLIKDIFKSEKVKVMSTQELKKAHMGLILGVGGGADTGPYLVQLSIKKAGKNKKTTAFVGKGITFDSGGLDIKPASAMRLMKKDMGGSATLVGLAYYLMKTRAKVNCEFYLGIAENAISSKSFRPGDVLKSKKGLTVEIHNTDAEGRLVLADALYLAATQNDKPQVLIDVATLTGAIKAGLGAYLPGLFCNNEKLQNELLTAAKVRSEPLWPMPLDPQMESSLQSNVADIVNSNDGFGGAINAALFLEKFTEGLPWAHFDIYAWTDSPRGALREKGGSGQLVQSLIKYLGVLS
ncbi:MAG: leucyl aminopeptidase family protein [Bdellovibrionales bacterium]|nr:leucyl aminopeptidase family protein [Bdellovibrionales bacterium]